MPAGDARPSPPRHRGGPVLLAVADDARLLSDVQRELEGRYLTDYRVCCLTSAAEARVALGDFAAAGTQVALVLAGELQGETTGTALLAEVQHSHPQAQRVLLVAWGRLSDPAVGEAVFEARSRGRLDHFLVEPSLPPDEEFHQAISSFLLTWAEAGQRAPHTVDVVGRAWSGRAAELREVLGRCAIPHRFHLAGTEAGRAVLASAGARRLPIIRMPDGTVLEDPSDAEIASASGTTVDPDGDRYDLVIVGGGPAGLSAGVYGSSEGLRTLVIDSGGIGGQATASSAIRNYLGFPRGVSGGELARRAYQQAWVFGTRFALMQKVTRLSPEDDGIAVTLSSGGVATGRVVVLAMGASYRLLDVEPLEALRGAGVFYGAAASEAPTVCGDEVFVVGGANSAGQAALHLAHYARRVTLVVRAARLDVGMSHYLVQQIGATPNIDVRTGTEVVDGGGDGWLQHLTLRRRDDDAREVVDADHLFLMIGATPHTGWLPPAVERDPGGFVMTGSDVDGGAFETLGRGPLAMETSIPSVLAAGDVRHGSVKRVASAVGEGSIAIQLVHRLLSARA
jgi:thioredoxin reductase (NADPH)